MNEAVTPLGSPVTLRETLPLNPALGVTVMRSVALAPCVTLGADAALMEKLAAGATVNVMLVLAVRFPAVPVTVTVAAPNAAPALAAKFNTLAVAVLVGLNEAVTPLGSPDTLRLTVLLNPLSGVTVMLAPPPPPGLILSDVGAGLRANDGMGVTCRVSPTLAVSVPETPWTVKG